MTGHFRNKDSPLPQNLVYFALISKFVYDAASRCRLHCAVNKFDACASNRWAEIKHVTTLWAYEISSSKLKNWSGNFSFWKGLERGGTLLCPPPPNSADGLVTQPQSGDNWKVACSTCYQLFILRLPWVQTSGLPTYKNYLKSDLASSKNNY